MRRLYLVAAVVGLWPVAAPAQEGLAPTAPVVPAPVLQNGNVMTPGGSGWGTGGPRLFTSSKWSPFRNPATASPVEPTAAYAYAQPQSQPLPPLPSGLSGLGGSAGATPDANCGPAGCGKPGRDRSCWTRLKAFFCFHDSPTELPKCRPTPYITPLQGMFPCTAGAAGCGTGCGTGGSYGYGPATDIRYGVPSDRQPPAYVPPVMQPPQSLQSSGTTAGPVVMPARGMQGSVVQPTFQGRVVPESAVSVKPVPGTIVPTGYLRPAPK